MPKVTIYVRNHKTREYELAEPRTIYPQGTARTSSTVYGSGSVSSMSGQSAGFHANLIDLRVYEPQRSGRIGR
jgi:hypothetical protein